MGFPDEVVPGHDGEMTVTCNGGAPRFLVGAKFEGMVYIVLCSNMHTRIYIYIYMHNIIYVHIYILVTGI